jgi:purine-binding chemotaxis protein CheW
MDAEGAGGGSPALVLRCGPARYAVVMSAVVEVGRLPAITRVPGVPEWVAGLVNWRGRILAVVDLSVALHRGRHTASEPAPDRLVVLTHAGLSVGLAVGAVAGTLQLERGELRPVPATLASGPAALLAGQVLDSDGPLGVLDVEAIFALRETLPGYSPSPRASAGLPGTRCTEGSQARSSGGLL